MPEKQKIPVEGFSKLKNLLNQASPQSLLKSIPNSVNKIKGKRQEKELAKELIGIDKRNTELDNITVDNKNKVREARLEALKQVYATMESMGVNPGDLNSIAEFREKLMREDPDLADLFFNAFDTLTQGIETDIEEEAPPEDLLGRSVTNLQEPLLRR